MGFCFNGAAVEGEHSEVEEALFGFLDSDLPPLDTVFQRDVDSSMLSSSPANGEDPSLLPSLERIHDHFLQFDAIFLDDFDSSMLSSSPANGEPNGQPNGEQCLNSSTVPTHGDSHLIPLETIFEYDVDSLMLSEGLNSYTIPSTTEPIQQQAPPFQDQSSFFYPPIEQPTTMGGGGDNCCSMSRQSEAARKRRKRISEKTLELASLIPGGNTMNTAQMLQAAFKYLYFLQSQVAILRLLASSFPECKCAKEEDLHILLASPSFQQRLSEEGMCVVPTEMMDGT